MLVQALSMDERERKTLQSLALMCDQYLRTPEGDLDHLCMTAGEDAVRLLIQHGLIIPMGRGGHWSEAGLAILNAPKA